MPDQASPKRPAAPKGLGNAGRALWRRLLEDLHPAAEFDARELVLLTTACRQQDMITQLETAVRRDGVMVEGSKGQQVVNKAVPELRACRLALRSLLGELGFPEDDELAPETSATRRARKAAHARHGTPLPEIPGQRRLTRRGERGAA